MLAEHAAVRDRQLAGGLDQRAAGSRWSARAGRRCRAGSPGSRRASYGSGPKSVSSRPAPACDEQQLVARRRCGTGRASRSAQCGDAGSCSPRSTSSGTRLGEVVAGRDHAGGVVEPRAAAGPRSASTRPARARDTGGRSARRNPLRAYSSSTVPSGRPTCAWVATRPRRCGMSIPDTVARAARANHRTMFAAKMVQIVNHVTITARAGARARRARPAAARSRPPRPSCGAATPRCST